MTGSPHVPPLPTHSLSGCNCSIASLKGPFYAKACPYNAKSREIKAFVFIREPLQLVKYAQRKRKNIA